MANSQAQRIVNRPIYDNVSLDIERTETFGVSKASVFKTLFFGRFGTLVLLNLLTMIFAVPAAVVIVLFYTNAAIAVGMVPYSGNIGFGLAVTVDAASVGAATAFDFLVYECLILLPCIAVFGLGVAGNIYVVNKLVTGEEVHMFKDFFRGIKRGGLSCFILAAMLGVVIVGIILAADFFDVYGLHVAYKVVTLIVAIILLTFLVLFTMFFITQTATAKMSVGKRIRNSFLFMFGTNVQAILFAAIAIAPVFLVFIPGMLALYIMLYVLIGVSYSALVIAAYCRGCYEKYTEGKPAEVNQASYVKRDAKDKIKSEAKSVAADDKAQGAEKVEASADSGGNAIAVAPQETQGKKKQPVQQYKNPKKKKRIITPARNSVKAAGGASESRQDEE